MSGWWEYGYPGGPPVGPSQLPRPLYAPGNPGGYPASDDGPDVVAIKRAISRLGRWPWQAFDDTFSPGFARGTGGNVVNTGVAGFQRQQGLRATGNVGDETYQNLRYARIPEGLPKAGQPAFDSVAVDLLKSPPLATPVAQVTTLGPVYAGGAPILSHDLTHATGGIPLYPAFDDCFAQGRTIIAPEPLKVTQDSSANPGDACYCDGASGLRYWFGHLSQCPPAGRSIPKGGAIGTVAANNVGGGPHVHVGVNVERIWGAGKQLAHHENYTHGAPTIGEQLEAGYAL